MRSDIFIGRRGTRPPGHAKGAEDIKEGRSIESRGKVTGPRSRG